MANSQAAASVDFHPPALPGKMLFLTHHAPVPTPSPFSASPRANVLRRLGLCTGHHLSPIYPQQPTGAPGPPCTLQRPDLDSGFKASDAAIYHPHQPLCLVQLTRSRPRTWTRTWTRRRRPQRRSCSVLFHWQLQAHGCGSSDSGEGASCIMHRAPCTRACPVAALCHPLSAADAAFLLGACPWSCVDLPKGPSAYPLSCIVHTTSADSDRHFPLPLHTRNDVHVQSRETAGSGCSSRVVCYVSVHRVRRLHSSPILTAGAVSLCLCVCAGQGTRDRTCCLPVPGA